MPGYRKVCALIGELIWSFICTFIRTFICALLLLPGLVWAGEKNVEEQLARASALFYEGKPREALGEVERGLELEASSRPALEMKAIVLQALGKDEEALALYKKLQSRTKGDAGAPYFFQMGVVEMNLGFFRQAALHFAAARKMNFNGDAALLFQALARYRDKDRFDAKKLLLALKVRGTQSDALHAAADYYLSRIALDQGQREDALALLKDALRVASTATARTDTSAENLALARQIRDQAQVALTESEQSQVLVGVETFADYDSNPVLRAPAASGDLPPTTFKQSLLAALAAGAEKSSGRAWSVTERTLFNYNFNKETKDFEFAANELEVEWSFLPLGTSRIGVMVNGLALFRNESLTGGESFHTYLLSLMPGLLLESRPEVSRWRVEVSGGHAQVLDDPDQMAANRRSADVIEAAFAWRRDRQDGPWNPSLRLEYLRNSTAGTEFRASYLRLFLGDKLYFGKASFSAQAEADVATYPDRPAGVRNDTLLAASGLLERPLGTNFSFLAHAGFTNNQSSIPELFSYERVIVGIGLRCVF